MTAATTAPTAGPTAARYDALDRAGDRCECRKGECGTAHIDTGGGRCPIISHWPDVVDLVVTPTDPALSLDDVDGMPVEALTVRCWDCWRGAHQGTRSRGEISSVDDPNLEYAALAILERAFRRSTEPPTEATREV